MAPRIVIGLLVALAASGGEVLAARPEVLVQFEVDVPEFDADRPGMEQARLDVRRALADELQRKYVFANWRVAEPDQSPLEIGRLVLRMEADRQTRPMPSVFVKFWGASARPGVALKDLGIMPIEIYAPTDPNWDTNDARAFASHVLQNTMVKVRSSAFADEVFSNFISRLPIGSSVVPDTSDQVIEIPVQWDELLLAPESELVVRFGRSTDQMRQEGTMTLGQIAARVSQQAPAPGDSQARLRGSVTRASFDARTIVLNDRRWNDELPQLLDGADAQCFISVYKPRDPLAGDSERFGL